MLVGALAAVLMQAVPAAATPPRAQAEPAATPESAPREIKDPDWRRVRAPSSPLQYYPQIAARREIEGAATIACIVNADGILHDCRILDETPPGVGFGDAAIKMSVLFRMRPLTKSGEKVDGGVVRIPIRFQLPR